MRRRFCAASYARVSALAAPPAEGPGGVALRARWDLATPAARERGDAGNRRLHARWQQFQARKKRHHVATVAIARELAGWCWSIATIDD